MFYYYPVFSMFYFQHKILFLSFSILTTYATSKTTGDTTFQARTTYARDLVEQAGKLDPVIGRDDCNTLNLSLQN
ncbi:hypothetical protein Lalb_Chr12g0197121 [Lupinus albus]|uniref:Uncharacterized protein n=1 Tax=Lupinus albus TaxID=3870 RepID=A0A6A4PL06_LUPAL|nr:hypothetical protein Lalb_Chr12g0197121 [Lupinus albus]